MTEADRAAILDRAERLGGSDGVGSDHVIPDLGLNRPSFSSSHRGRRTRRGVFKDLPPFPSILAMPPSFLHPHGTGQGLPDAPALATRLLALVPTMTKSGSRFPILGGLLLLAVLTPSDSSDAGAQESPQTQADDYTRYELQAPGSGAFRIFYDVTATTPGKVHYFNTIRIGAEEEVHGVSDLMTGGPLDWEIVDGAEARRTGHPRANPEGRYIRVRLARPVPYGGEARIRIDKTYVDRDSYFEEGGEIVFQRSLGIKRNAVVLPRGFELVEVNHPSQVAVEDDGRVRVSFLNRGPAAVPYRVRARRLPPSAATPTSTPQATPPNHPEPPPATGRAEGAVARVAYSFSQRAFQDREIIYFLLQPETHSFRLYHDYTETRPGVDRYLNVVRAGSSASDPEAYLLDTGERLTVETLKGSAIPERGIELSRPPADDTEVVVIWFDPASEGESRRLRIWETYTDPGRYLHVDGELVWDRNFGRPRNAVVLPEGWYLTTSAIPAVVSETEDGRIRLDFWNDGPQGIQVFVKALRRQE